MYGLPAPKSSAQNTIAKIFLNNSVKNLIFAENNPDFVDKKIISHSQNPIIFKDLGCELAKHFKNRSSTHSENLLPPTLPRCGSPFQKEDKKKTWRIKQTNMAKPAASRYSSAS
ncbi:hypothetical protein [Polycladidibacter hongkongensis]|uniref:hypothetical protein n=1 Tax=Polycladidibacter hongkongensis TaxID=1647556 RepID=UPI000833C750|nr:hypothetical protein [Pseudovibrio hongkongensis]